MKLALGKGVSFALEGRLQTVIAILLAAIAGLGVAYYNGFPLTYTDSGEYIKSGASHFVPRDRPIGYGLFIHATSHDISLWLTVFLQSLLAASLCYVLLKRLSPIFTRTLLVGLFVLLSFSTGMSLTISMLSPDIFAPLVAIVALLVILPSVPRDIRYVLLLLLVMLNLFHLSDALIAVAMMALVLVSTFMFRLERQVERRWVWITLVVSLASPLLMATLHWSVDGRFRTVEARNVFLVASLAEKGVLQRYLDDNCKGDAPIYSLCRYRDEIPTNATQFIWANKSIVLKTNGWLDPDGQYPRVIRSILTQPRYLAMTAARSVKATVAQFFDFDLFGYGAPTASTTDTLSISYFDRHEYARFLSARQYLHQLNFSVVSHVQAALVYGSMLAWLMLVVFRRRLELPQNALFVLCYVMAALWANAAITATFSSVVDRYQSRMVWLLVFVVAATIASLVLQHRAKGNLSAVVDSRGDE